MPSIDFHGKTWSESLAAFIDLYNRSVHAGGSGSVDVVHGYGSSGAGGVLRTRIRAFLEKHPQRLQFKPGEELDGNPGHTLVVPLQRLPDTGELLAEQVWEYCERPRTLNKITGRFRRHGDPQVLQAIRSLEAQRRLRATNRGRVKVYEAV